MNRSIMTLGLLFVLSVAITSVTAQPTRGTAGAASDFNTRYEALIDGNIFKRERGRRPVAPPATRPAPPSPEQSIVLTGVVLEESQFRAYFENTRTNSIVRAGPGDLIGLGSVNEIAINAIAYASEDGIRWIEIGQDLTGSEPASAWRRPATSGGGLENPPAASGGLQSNGPGRPPGDSGAATSSGGTAPADEAPADNATMSIEERMRLRRLQQLNR